MYYQSTYVNFVCCVLIYSEEEQALKEKWHKEFRKDSDASLNRSKAKPKFTTTKEATVSGRLVEKMLAATKAKPYVPGSKSRYKEAEFAEAFKSVSAFTEFFTEEWDLILRIAADPAHEFYNLVKDMLKLICSLGVCIVFLCVYDIFIYTYNYLG